MAPKGDNSMHKTEEDLELAENFSSDSTHNFDVIDLDSVDFQPFLTNRSGIALNYHSSDHLEHKLLIRESFIHDRAEEVNMRRTAYALLRHPLVSYLERQSQSSTSPAEHEQSLPRRYVTLFGVVTFICFIAMSHIRNAMRFLPTLVHTSGLRENLSPHALPREDTYRDYDLPLELWDTPVYWDLGAGANTTPMIMSTTCFTRAHDSRPAGGPVVSSIHIVVTQQLWGATDLFNTTHRGRLFSMFRDPIERLVSEYHVSQNADVRPTFEEFLSTVPNNYLVRSLVNKMEGPVNEDHLNTAKELVRRKLLVGLFEEQAESIRRIEAYFGWKRQSSEECRSDFLGTELQKETPQTKTDSSYMQKILTDANHFDLELYDFIKLDFREQMALFKE